MSTVFTGAFAQNYIKEQCDNLQLPESVDELLTLENRDHRAHRLLYNALICDVSYWQSDNKRILQLYAVIHSIFINRDIDTFDTSSLETECGLKYVYDKSYIPTIEEILSCKKALGMYYRKYKRHEEEQPKLEQNNNSEGR